MSVKPEEETISPGQFFQAAQEARDKALRGVKIQCICNGVAVISPQYSITQARLVPVQDLLNEVAVRKD